MPAEPKGKKGGKVSSKKKKARSKRSIFGEDLASMMHAYGDEKEPLPESVALLEEMVLDFMTQIIQMTAKLSPSQNDKLRTENLLFVIRKHKPLYTRAVKHLRAQEDIKKAKAAMRGGS